MGPRGSVQRKELHAEKDSLQLQTFQRWWNSYLEPRDLPVTDLVAQIQDGVVPLRLIEALEKLPAAPVRAGGRLTVMGERVNAAPRMRLQCIANLNAFLTIVTVRKRIPLVNISAEDLCDGNLTLVLGLTWEIIKFYELGGARRAAGAGGDVGDIGGSTAGSKVGGGKAGGGASGELLEWVKAETVGYEGCADAAHSRLPAPRVPPPAPLPLSQRLDRFRCVRLVALLPRRIRADGARREARAQAARAARRLPRRLDARRRGASSAGLHLRGLGRRPRYAGPS